EFDEKYGATFEHIKSRKPLTENINLVRMSFLRDHYSKSVESIRTIREEKKRVSEGLSGVSGKLKSELLRIYEGAEKILRARLELELETDLRLQAETFIELKEQVQLVDYLSGVDAFSIKQSYEKREYKAKQASSLSYNLLYWPEENEYWVS